MLDCRAATASCFVGVGLLFVCIVVAHRAVTKFTGHEGEGSRVGDVFSNLMRSTCSCGGTQDYDLNSNNSFVSPTSMNDCLITAPLFV